MYTDQYGRTDAPITQRGVVSWIIGVASWWGRGFRLSLNSSSACKKTASKTRPFPHSPIKSSVASELSQKARPPLRRDRVEVEGGGRGWRKSRVEEVEGVG